MMSSCVTRISLELTLAILKPHVVKASHALKAIHRIIVDNKFLVVQSTKVKLSQEQVNKFYKEHSGRFFFNRLVTSMMRHLVRAILFVMSSGESEVHILAKVDAVQNWRQLMGPTKVYQTIFTHPESIRGQFGLTDTRNATHGSDSLESAKREIAVFFPDFDVVRWLQENEVNYHSGKLSSDFALIKCSEKEDELKEISS